MSKSLAEILGWEEGAVYRYNNKFFKIKHGLLVSSLTRGQDVWYLDVSILLNEFPYLMKATKVEPKKYYLKHKFLGNLFGTYLNYKYSTGGFCLSNTEEAAICQTQFTDSEIEEIEARGFDLCNYEKVEVEDE